MTNDGNKKKPPTTGGGGGGSNKTTSPRPKIPPRPKPSQAVSNTNPVASSYGTTTPTTAPTNLQQQQQQQEQQRPPQQQPEQQNVIIRILKMPFTTQNLHLFPENDPWTSYLSFSYAISVWFNLFSCLLALLSVPYTFLMMRDSFGLLGSGGQSSDFIDFLGFSNFCWMFASFFLSSYLAFFVWYLPLRYEVIERVKRSRAFLGSRKGTAVPATINTSLLSSDGELLPPQEQQQQQQQQSASTAAAAVAGGADGSLQKTEEEGEEEVVVQEEQVTVTSSSATTVITASASASPVVTPQQRPADGNFSLKSWFACIGCSLFIGFSMLQFSGSFFSIGILYVVKVRDSFRLQFEAAGMNFSDRMEVVAVPVAATVFFGIQLVVSIVWLILVLRRKWVEHGKRFGVIVILIFLTAGITMLLIWMLVWNKGRFFPNLAYKRGLCFKNSCNSETLYVNMVGGATGLKCVATNDCPEGTVCNTLVPLAARECYFSLPVLTRGGLKLTPGARVCVPFYPPVHCKVRAPGGAVLAKQLVAFSGMIFASTGCSGGICETALSPNDREAYVGPTGAVTIAEMTMLTSNVDYFDISIIGGINVPMKISPKSPTGVFRPNPDASGNPSYYCTSPGDTGNFDSNTAMRSNWKPNPTSEALRLVGGGSGSSCPCSNSNEFCGTSMVTVGGKPTQQIRQNVCGNHRGYWSWSELCSWTNNAYSGCTTQASDGLGTLAELGSCSAPYTTSCYQKEATPTCCGCSNWGLPGAFPCKSSNPSWTSEIKPKLQFLKSACPTCYVFAFDDSTSTFTCASNTSSADGSLTNDNSLDIEFCPGGIS